MLTIPGSILTIIGDDAILRSARPNPAGESRASFETTYDELPTLENAMLIPDANTLHNIFISL